MSAMLDLTRLTSFVALVDAGSFTTAAKALGLTKAAVSQHVQKLEAELRCTLVVRTSRRLAPTDAGLRLHAAATELLAQAARVEAQARELPEIAGTMRIASTNEYLATVLAPILARFVREHPRLRLELFGGPDLTDVVAARVDLAIRFGEPPVSALKATKLTRFRLLPVATPALLAEHGTPSHPRELARLPWILHRRHRNPFVWERGGERVEVRVESRILTDAVDANRTLALASEGAMYGAEWRVGDDVAAGRLVHMLPDWTPPSVPVYAVRAEATHVPARVRTLIQYLRAALG